MTAAARSAALPAPAGSARSVPVIPGPRAGDPLDPAQRLERLFDPGTCELLTPPDDSGHLAATGLVHGVRAVAHASDAAVQDGALGGDGGKVVLAAYERALAQECPVIALIHSAGTRLAEGISSLHAVGELFAVMTRASGRIPQISVVLGPAAGGAAYGPALADIVILGPAGRIAVAGPETARPADGVLPDRSPGDRDPHTRRSGVVHMACDTDDSAYAKARILAAMLGDQGRLDPAAVEDRDLAQHLPASPHRAYDAHPLVNALLDRPGLELHPKWAPNVVTSVGRFGGRTVGVVANNPLRLGGCLDAASAEKAARFVRMCDSFGVPLLVLVDVPGHLSGAGQEWDGVVRRGAKLLHAFAEAVVPRITLVTRKAHGGGYLAMNSRALGATRVLAWPDADVAVMGAVSAVRVLHRAELAGLAEAGAGQRTRRERELAAEHAERTGGIRHALEAGVVDEIVTPRTSRSALAAALAAAPGGSGGGEPVRGRHGNIPL